MRTTLLALAGLALLLAAMPAQADCLPVEPIVEADGDHVRVGYQHNVGLGGNAWVDVSQDGVWVHHGEGITNCNARVNSDLTIEPYHCVF